MAKKIKCDDCKTWNGGFHLCPGVKVLPSRPAPNFNSTGDKTSAYVQSIYQKNHDRDQKILRMYNEGEIVAVIETACGVSRQTIREVVKRLGGVVRDKSWQPEGWEPFNKGKTKENA